MKCFSKTQSLDFAIHSFLFTTFCHSLRLSASFSDGNRCHENLLPFSYLFIHPTTTHDWTIVYLLFIIIVLLCFAFENGGMTFCRSVILPGARDVIGENSYSMPCIITTYDKPHSILYYLFINEHIAYKCNIYVPYYWRWLFWRLVVSETF